MSWDSPYVDPAIHLQAAMRPREEPPMDSKFRSASQQHLFNRVYTYWNIVCRTTIPDRDKPLFLQQHMPEDKHLMFQQADEHAARTRRTRG